MSRPRRASKAPFLQVDASLAYNNYQGDAVRVFNYEGALALETVEREGVTGTVVLTAIEAGRVGQALLNLASTLESGR